MSGLVRLKRSSGGVVWLAVDRIESVASRDADDDEFAPISSRTGSATRIRMTSGMHHDVDHLPDAVVSRIGEAAGWVARVK